jgi:hypothetical protein
VGRLVQRKGTLVLLVTNLLIGALVIRFGAFGLGVIAGSRVVTMLLLMTGDCSVRGASNVSSESDEGSSLQHTPMVVLSNQYINEIILNFK